MAFVCSDSYFIKNIGAFACTYESLIDADSKKRFVKYVCCKAINSSAVKFYPVDMDVKRDVTILSSCELENNHITGFSNIGDLKLWPFGKWI